MKYQVHYPKIGRVTIKVDNVIMKYFHNDIVDEQAFFVRYPHIFIPRPDLKDAVEAKEPETKMVEDEQEFKPVMPGAAKKEELPVPIPTPETKKKDEAIQATFDELNEMSDEQLQEELENAPSNPLAEAIADAVAPVEEEKPKKRKRKSKKKAEEPVEDKVEEVSEPEEVSTELNVVETESKGWYIVADAHGAQLFPEEGKKVRKKKAEEFIKENE